MAAWILSTIGTIFTVILFLIVITQTVTIKISKCEAFLLEFNFMFLALSLILSKRDRDVKEKKKKKKPQAAVILRTLAFGLSGSHLELRKFDFPSMSAAPIFQGLIAIPRSALLAYFINAAASFELSEENVTDDTEICAVIYTPLFHLIFTALFYFKERLKIICKARARQ